MCWGEAYSLDSWGNLLSIAATTNSQYTGCTVESGFTKTADAYNHLSGLSYDASGNTLTDGVNTYTWDGESQLKSGGGANYLHDGVGRRAAKVGSKLYWHGSGGEILAETDASGNTLNEYIFFGGKRVALLPSGGTAQYYAEDLLGTSRVITTNTGTVCYDADFYPFGGERAPYTDTCTQNNYKFQGKERDTETGNDDFGARHYSSRFGRWLSSDWSSVPVPVPYANLTNPQTLNLYAMVSDDPETSADLDGHLSAQEYRIASYGGFWDPTFAGSGVDANGLTQIEFDLMLTEWFAEHPQQQNSANQQTGQTPSQQDKGANSGQKLKAKPVKHPPKGTTEITWRLSKKSKTGGYIVQEITTTDKSGKQTSHFWEAWQVSKGSKNTTYHDQGYDYDDMFRDSSGTTVHADARFYEGLQLPSSFVPGSPGTTAGILPATSTNPELPTNHATPPVDRTWTAP